MKKLILIALISLSSLANAQSQFNGIGRLKIGIDTLELQDLLKESKIKLTVATKPMDVYGANKTSAVKLIYPTNGAYIFNSSPLLNVNVYFIKELNISGIPISNIYLKFLDNKLFSFKSNYSRELKEAMELKYPDFKNEIKRDTTQCLAKTTGNKYDLVATSFVSDWKNNNISAQTLIGDYYDKNCQKSIVSWVRYQDNTIDMDVSKREKEVKQSTADKNKEKVKSTLKDF